MANAAELVELWRGELLESTHRGHAVIAHTSGDVLGVWGDAARVIFPRSSAKMFQALPLVESGAADAAGLNAAHLALACASHEGSALHVGMAQDWLAGLGLGESDLRCGAHMPYDRAERDDLIKSDTSPCQFHNNCSGKHSGFLTTVQHLRAGPEYTEIEHPLQLAVREAFESATGEDSAGWGIDGCSAPNFACTVGALARGAAQFAGATDGGSGRMKAMARLTQAMAANPMLVAGEGRACTELMAAMGGRVAIKTGAEAVFVAIIPERQIGIALKIEDGNTRASEAVMTALLIKLGVLEAQHPAAQKRLPARQINWRGKHTGELRLAQSFA
jgi:L-asparaginase II